MNTGIRARVVWLWVWLTHRTIGARLGAGLWLMTADATDCMYSHSIWFIRVRNQIIS